MGSAPFPIDEARAEFERATAGGSPVVVAAPTGSGKSTRLPEWLDEMGHRVLVIEPRRVACRALAGWVASRRGEAVGASVGYRVRFGDQVGEQTRIAFVTPGIALNLLADGLPHHSFVLVDEFHERSWEMDLAVALVRALRDKGRELGLALCSATLDTEALVERLDARLVESEGRSFPVEVRHANDGPPSERELDSRVANAVRSVLHEDDDGDVLVFLPGKSEIEAARRELEVVDAELVVVHAQIPPERMQEVLGKHSRRRVFLATNVAETSLTLPGVTSVVDSGLARMRIHRAGRSVLALSPISRASMDQRAGRAGRVAAGRCVRLWGRSYAPTEVTRPELERIELDDLVLRAGQCGLQGEALETAPWVTPPPDFALQQARDRLHRLGALDENGCLTRQGQAQARVPVSAFESRMLIDVPAHLAETIVDIVALLEVGRDLLLPGAAADDARRELFTDLDNEVYVQLTCLREGDPRRHGLHRSALGEARRLSKSLRAALGLPTGSKRQALPPRDVLGTHLLMRVPQAAFARRARADRKRARERRSPSEPWGNGEIELSLRPYRIPGLLDDEQPDPPRVGLVLDHTWIGVGRSARGVGRMLLPCHPSQLVAAGIGEAIVGEPKLVRGIVMAPTEFRHAGAQLGSEERRLLGGELRLALADLLLANRVRKGLGDRIREALHLWDLVGQSSYDVETPSAPEPFIVRRLETLGLEDSNDLALVDDDDLVPDVEAMALAAGLSPRELASLRDDFPATFSFEGAVYRCEIDLARKRVVLEPGNKVARGKNEPPVRVLPRFRGFRVEYRKASRRVKLR